MFWPFGKKVKDTTPPIPVGPTFAAPTAGNVPYVPAGMGYAPVIRRDTAPVGVIGFTDDRYTTNVQVENYDKEWSWGEEGWITQISPDEASAPAFNPRSIPAPVERIATSPSNYRFLRAFDQHAARQLNGNHFSMATHRRDFPIGGMQPTVSRRNTYRTEPAPWDIRVVDKPTDESVPVNATFVSPDLPPDVTSHRRTWRL